MTIKNAVKKMGIAVLSAALMVSSLTGCASKEKEAVKASAEGFLGAIKDGNVEAVAQYATPKVAEGEFVKIFEPEYMEDLLAEKIPEVEFNDEAKAKLEEFYKSFSTMVESYEVTDVTIGKDKKAKATAVITTSFPIDVLEEEAMTEKLTQAISDYYSANSAEVSETLITEGEDSTSSNMMNQLMVVVLDVYIDTIANSQGDTYVADIDLTKDTVLDKWLVSDFKVYRQLEEGEMPTDASTTAAQDTTTASASSSASSN